MEECAFHAVTNFHIIKNHSVDIMHDLFEGVCRYDLGKVLFHLIYKDKLFSCEMLNNRIYSFDYGDQHSTNKPPAINVDAIKKKYVIYSASEMSTLWQYLGLIIGDLIRKGNKIWQLYITVREMLSFIMAQEVNDETVNLLRNIIKKHHELYLNLFDDTLKPKFHFILHYPQIMQQTGPVKYMSSMHFEAKHKEIKQTANAITSRQNPAYTLSTKLQLKLNYRFILH